MNIREDLCQFHPGHENGLVVVESDGDGKGLAAAIDELRTPDARKLAISYAASQGVTNPGVAVAGPSPYPVNRDGTPLEEVKSADGTPLDKRDPRLDPACYRVNFPIQRGR